MQGKILGAAVGKGERVANREACAGYRKRVPYSDAAALFSLLCKSKLIHHTFHKKGETS